jgi:nucleoside-diphosphate-sugar epimerase
MGVHGCKHGGTMKNILVAGACGYVGSLLSPQLKSAGYNVFGFDIGWFGTEHFPDRGNLYKADIRDATLFEWVCKKHEIDTVINLACVSNDASFKLNKKLSKSINLEAFEPMVKSAKSAEVKRFISASTSSVYGVSDAKNITEEHPLVPLTLYNKYKAQTEPLLLKHLDDDFQGIIIRPATLCGYAPRLRLDLTVNILTNHAITNHEIKVFGGEQMRPNLHIADMCDLYELLVGLPRDSFPSGEIYNCGYSNFSINDVADIVKYTLKYYEYFSEKDIKITKVKSDDTRSYHINSNKILRDLRFSPKHYVTQAVRDLYDAFREGKVPDSMTDSNYYNVRKLKELKVK